MPSFEFADCPTRLPLASAPDTQEQTGSVTCTVRNTTQRRQTARIHVEVLGGAKSAWFALGGASPTSPLEIEEDIAAGGSLTVQVTARIPARTQPGTETFRLRAISEARPDTDFAEGPAIALEIAASAEPAAPVKQRLPWWAFAVGALFVAMVLGGVAFLTWPSRLDPKLVIGKPLAEARTIAAEHGFPNIAVESGDAWGNDPAKRVVVGFNPAGPTFEVDDGVQLPPDIIGRPFAEAGQIMLDRGVFPAQPVLGQVIPGGAEGQVIMISPPPGVPLAIGTPIVVTVAARMQPPALMPGVVVPCASMPGHCNIMLANYSVNDLNSVSRERLEKRDRMVEIILGGQ